MAAFKYDGRRWRKGSGRTTVRVKSCRQCRKLALEPLEPRILLDNAGVALFPASDGSDSDPGVAAGGVPIGPAVTSHEDATLAAAWGLNGQYFASRDLTGLAFERVDPQVDFAWGYGSPGAPIGSDDFSIRWTGFVLPRYSEIYTFHTMTDDGVRLWVDDELLIDRWVNQGTTEYTATTYLEAGRQVAIKMEYYESGGLAVARLLWSSSTQPREVIPSSCLTTLSVPQLEVDTRGMVEGELNVNGPAPRSVGLVGFEESTNPPATLYAIRIGMSPGAGWLHLDTRGGRTDVYADGAQPEWHTADEWAPQRLRGLQPDRIYALYAKAGDGQGFETGSMPVATFTTNIDCDVDAGGDVTGEDCAYVEAAISSGGELGVELPWACDVNDDGAVDDGDRAAVAWRIDNPVPSEGPVELHVAPGGSDSNPGTFDQPLATLEGAKAAVRVLKCEGLSRGGIVVWLRGGVYERSVPFALTDADAGAPERPIAWRAFPNETVRIVGGTRLEPTWFEPVTEASPVWDRIDPAAQGQLLQVDLSAHGITDYGELANRGYKLEAPAALELFFNGQPMELGRWPNCGFEMTVSAPSSSQFTYSGTRPERWVEADDVWVHGYWSYDYADVHNRVVAIDTATQTITIEGYRHYGVRADQPWYAYNLLEEIDWPGEWCLDRGTGILYFMLPGDLAAGETWVSTLNADLLRLNGAAYVSFEGVRFELSRWGLVVIDGGDHNALVDCVLLGAGTDAAVIEGTDVALEGCEIAWPGRGGVRLAGGDRYTLAPSGNSIRNCDIHDFSRFDFTYTPGIRLDGCGHVVAHNVIHDASHSAIMYGGNEHRIEYNDIYNVCRLAGDAGALYTHGDWASQGNVLRHNFIHHVNSGLNPSGTGDVEGIYFDACDSGDTVVGNVLYRISSFATLNACGRDNIFENNVIAHANTAHMGNLCGVPLINNTPGSGMNQLEKINEFDYQNPPWSVAYPHLAAIPNDYDLIDPYRGPGGSVFSRNLVYDTSYVLRENSYWGAGCFDWYEEIADNLSGQDPRFVDEAALDLDLQPDSPAWSIPGFQPIPFDEIGLAPGPARLAPADGELAELRPALCWSDVPGAAGYDVYLGRDEDAVRAADRSSAPFQGNVTDSQFTPPANLLDGCTYFWRVDALTDAGTIAGEVHRFTAGCWQQRSIGDVALLGSMAFCQGTFTLAAGGSDIWGSSDAFHYVYREVGGDGEIVARVAGVEQQHEHTKAGVMIRESLDASSRYADVVLHANGLVAFQYRTVVGGPTSSIETGPVTAPYWVKLVREGDLFTGCVSPDGQAWTEIGSAAISMASSVHIGLAATAHDNAALAAARFENVALAGAAEVVGRHVFYNGSVWDGGDASANAGDDAAIAPPPSATCRCEPDKEGGKAALLPGQTASFVNYTSYSKGINGIMVDIDGLADPDVLGAADFDFRVGNDGNPDGWAIGPPPQYVAVRQGAGVDGSDRVTLIWPDNDWQTPSPDPGAIANQWLRVTVLVTPNTGLAKADVFYFGNAIGECGNATTDAIVNATDEIRARSHPHWFLDPASVQCPFDYDRDKKVDATDQIIARKNQTFFLSALKLITAPDDPGALTQTSWLAGPSDTGCAPVSITAAQPQPGAAVSIQWAGEVQDTAPGLWAYGPTGWQQIADSVPASEGCYHREADEAANGWYCFLARFGGGPAGGRSACSEWLGVSGTEAQPMHMSSAAPVWPVPAGGDASSARGLLGTTDAHAVGRGNPWEFFARWPAVGLDERTASLAAPSADKQESSVAAAPGAGYGGPVWLAADAPAEVHNVDTQPARWDGWGLSAVPHRHSRTTPPGDRDVGGVLVRAPRAPGGEPAPARPWMILIDPGEPAAPWPPEKADKIDDECPLLF